MYYPGEGYVLHGSYNVCMELCLLVIYEFPLLFYSVVHIL